MFKKTKKTLSLLIVMSIVMSLFAGVATATTNTTFGSGFANVTVGNNRTAGQITATEREDASWGVDANSIFLEVRLPEGVTFNTRPDRLNLANYFTAALATDVTFEAASDNMLRVRLTPNTGAFRSSGTFSFAADGLSRLNIAAGVTGNIAATVDVHRIVGGTVHWVESATLPIARVAPRAVTVTGEAATLVQMGNNRLAARINIQEGAAGSLMATEVLRFEIVTEGVTFAAPEALRETGIDVGVFTIAADGRSASSAVTTSSSVFAGRVELTPRLNVNPGVTGDIRIRVRGSAVGATDTAVTTTTLTVATIGTAAVEITGATNTGGTVHAGRVAGEVGATTADDARFNLRATGGNVLPNDRIVVLELRNAKFEASAAPFGIEWRAGTGAWSTLSRTITRFDEDRKAWFGTDTLPETATEIRIRDIRVAVDADAVAGDLSVAVSGTIGATGTVVIGRIARAFTATSVATNLTYPGLNQSAGNIVITEAARGTIKAGTYTVNLPEGVAFNDSTVKPRVRVTAGDLRVTETPTISGRVLTFTVTGTSSEASTITIDRLNVDVARAAMEGNLAVGIRALGAEWQLTIPVVTPTSTANLATAVIGRIGDAVVGRASVFTIGALSFTRDGVSTPIDAPPVIVAGRTLLPLRFAALAVGVSADNILWDPVRRTVTLIGDRVVQLQIGSTSMLINGIAVPLEVAPTISGGRTMLPIRALATALRADIVWDGTARTVTVTPR